ncbi:MAG TPA: AlpA family phage regulatory protein [Gammaproteobacteria bacterium]|nr:AlpA family phage regulatory protein [Gammaproteobacteria bacterium]
MAVSSHSWRRDSFFILRRPEVQRRTGLSRSALYDQIACGEWPRPIKLTSSPNGPSGWFDHESDTVLAARAAGKHGEAICAVVEEIHEARALAGEVEEIHAVPASPAKKGRGRPRKQVGMDADIA